MSRDDWKDIPHGRPLVNRPLFQHGPDKVRRICLWLDPAHTKRYQPHDGKTYCNIFASDVCDIWGCPPRHIMDGRELNANATIDWLRGPLAAAAHWAVSDRASALSAATRGHLVLVGWHSGQTTPGHIGVVLPEGTLAQAGRQNFVGKPIALGFGNRTLEFFVQMRGATHGV